MADCLETEEVEDGPKVSYGVMVYSSEKLLNMFDDYLSEMRELIDSMIHDFSIAPAWLVKSLEKAVEARQMLKDGAARIDVAAMLLYSDAICNIGIENCRFLMMEHLGFCCWDLMHAICELPWVRIECPHGTGRDGTGCDKCLTHDDRWHPGDCEIWVYGSNEPEGADNCAVRSFDEAKSRLERVIAEIEWIHPVHKLSTGK